MMTVLVAAAFEPELAHLRTLVGTLREDDGPRVQLATIGVGLVDAAIGTAARIVEHRPTVALLLGTCGVFPGVSEVATGDVVTGRTVMWADESVLAGRAELPPPVSAAEALDVAIHDALVDAGARSLRVANTTGITVDAQLAARFGHVADVEHLEAFAFARACVRSGVRAGICLGVANAVGPDGRSEWRARHEAASTVAAEVALRALGRLLG